VSVQLQLGERARVNVHPVVWVFAQAESTLSTIEQDDAASLLTSPSQACRKWIESTPVLDAWFNSQAAFRARADWPVSVIDSFGVPQVPSPYEVANALPVRSRDGITATDGSKLVVAYACGVDVGTLAAALGTERGHILDAMRTGAADMGRNPRFAVWASNVDFNKSAFSLTLPKPLLERIRAQERLAENPLLADDGDVEFLMASPLFVAAARAGTLPKRQGYRQMRTRAVVYPPRDE
jgi:hypothetical protein